MSVNSKMTAIADAIRSKTGGTETLTLDEMAVAIDGIEAGGAELPELTNEGSAAELFAGKELVDGSGEKVTGTFTIDSELSTQDELIAQIQSALEGKSAGSTDLALQTKTIVPNMDKQVITPDAGYYGLSQVSVTAIPSVAQATPSITVDSSGLITASAAQISGYVAEGTKSGIKQLTTQGAKTVVPSDSSQVVVAAGLYTIGDVIVDAIPSNYVKPTTTQAATTYVPTISDQSIAAGTYCSGAQIIKGDSNLVAGNIKSGVSIFGVAGSYGGDSSGSGGGSVETCTLTINYIDGSGWGLVFYGSTCAVYEDGVITISYLSSTTRNNVVKNTPILIEFEGAGMSPNIFECNNCEVLYGDYSSPCLIYAYGDIAEITITAN